jgi:large subunit ribosomal protein L10
MENPRPEKVAVVNEVRERLDGAQAAILTEYRGLTVREMAALRQALAAAGGDYKVYKNTLVKLAIAGGRHEPLDALLQGPTAIAFVSGEVSAVAKALRDYARANPSLIVKGGLHGEGFLSAQDLGILADLPPRDVLLARIAGALAAPMQQLAGLIQAIPQSLAYGLSALLDQLGGVPAEPEAPAAEAATVEEAAPAEASGEPAPAEASTEAGAAEASSEPAPAEASAEVEAPVEAAPTEAVAEGAPPSVEASAEPPPAEAPAAEAPAAEAPAAEAPAADPPEGAPEAQAPAAPDAGDSE